MQNKKAQTSLCSVNYVFAVIRQEILLSLMISLINVIKQLIDIKQHADTIGVLIGSPAQKSQN